MAFDKYNWLIRLVLKQISEKNGGPTDTSRDHELADWTLVERFVERFSALLDSRHEGRLTPTPAGSTGIENENVLP
jgi:hypothetical protein